MVQKTDMIKLAKPFITDGSIANAVEVLKSGNLVQSEKVKELENKLCNYIGIKHVILVSSGTSALSKPLSNPTIAAILPICV